MVQARLIWIALLASAVITPRTDDSGVVEVAETSPASEADFRANDRDWCHVNDLWTIDVAGLYTMTGAQTLMADTDHALRVIEFTLGAAEEDMAAEEEIRPD